MTYKTVKELIDDKDVPFSSEAALRNYIFRADEVGLAPHIKRMGRKVLIDKCGLLDWVEKGIPALSANSPKGDKLKKIRIVQILNAENASFIYGLGANDAVYVSNGNRWHKHLDLPEE